MDISIIMVSFNAKDICVQTLNSLKSSLDFIERERPDLQIETIIVDNNSTDGINEIIESEFKFAKLIQVPQNLGFAKANNLGIKNSDKTAKYYLFLNNDILLEQDSITRMYDYMEKHPKVGMSTCRVDLYSGGFDWDCHRAFPTVWNSFCYFFGLEKYLGWILPGIFARYHIKNKNLNTEHEIDVCLGAFMLTPVSVIKQAELWPEDYFLNGEDVDLCFRIKKILGYKIVYTPITKIIHFKGASKGTKSSSLKISKADDKTKLLQINSGMDAMAIFYKKYYQKESNFFTNLIVKLGMWAIKQKRMATKKE